MRVSDIKKTQNEINKQFVSQQKEEEEKSNVHLSIDDFLST
jgi:hypothetical protein